MDVPAMVHHSALLLLPAHLVTPENKLCSMRFRLSCLCLKLRVTITQVRELSVKMYSSLAYALQTVVEVCIRFFLALLFLSYLSY